MDGRTDDFSTACKQCEDDAFAKAQSGRSQGVVISLSLSPSQAVCIWTGRDSSSYSRLCLPRFYLIKEKIFPRLLSALTVSADEDYRLSTIDDVCSRRMKHGDGRTPGQKRARRLRDGSARFGGCV